MSNHYSGRGVIIDSTQHSHNLLAKYLASPSAQRDLTVPSNFFQNKSIDIRNKSAIVPGFIFSILRPAQSSLNAWQASSLSSLIVEGISVISTPLRLFVRIS